MKIAIRADASARIGAGHVMRCLTLADELRGRGARICFVSRHMPDPLVRRIAMGGHELLRLDGPARTPTRPESSKVPEWVGTDQEHDAAETARLLSGERCDWLIVDHYGLDYHWERKVADVTRATLVVDDLARRHECAVLLDQNYYADRTERYSGRVPAATQCLLGPEYALLGSQFRAVRATLQVPLVDRLFVSVGANDPFGICQKVVAALHEAGGRAPGAEIVVGADESLLVQMKACTPDLPDVNIRGFVDDMAAVMAQCTMAIGAAGGSTWERCALGLPSLVVIAADNQRRMAEDLARAQIIVLLGNAAQVSASMLARSIAELREDTAGRASMRAAGMRLVDGHGAQRVANRLLEVSPCTS